MKNLKTRIAAATALGMLMAEAAPLAHAARPHGDTPAVDRIVTGPVPGETIFLAQAEGAAATEEETEEQRLRRERQQRGEQQEKAEPAQQEAPAEAERPAAPAEKAQPEAQPEEPAEAPPARAAQPEEQAPAEEPRTPPVRRAQPAEEAAPPASEPEQPAARQARPEPPAAEGGEGQASREERLRQRREALKKLQQDEGTADAPAEAPATAEQPAPAEPAAPAESAPPQQAEPAVPAEPEAGPAEQAEPGETDRERRLRERREALRKLQQGDQPADKVEGGPAAQPGAAEPPPEQAGEPAILEGSPENAAPILDSQKPRRRPGDNQGRGNDGQTDVGQGTGGQPVAPPIARAPSPPPQSDADAQTDAPRASDLPSVREEEGRRVEDRPRRYERPEGADVLREFGNRVILELGNQLLIENNDRSRVTRDAREVYYEELPRGRTRETIVRPNGVTIVTIRDRYGEVIRRSRIMPDGREYVLVYVDEDRLEGRGRGPWRDPGDDLPPLVIDIPYNDYIFDAERVDYDDDEAYFEFLGRPPVEKVERLYSVDEVKRSARVRDSVRRVDLDTVTFDTGSAAISDSQVEKLDGVATAMVRLLERNPAETFLIEGHTDAVGSDLSNLALSDERAESVAAALTKVFGVPAENLTTQGYGEQYLKINTLSAERENRRVAIRRITPLVAPVASAN